jgi:lipopolysaccharide cholinephosphotransferase
MINREDYKTEKICEYNVSSNRKKLWGIELDMLECLEKACKALSIDYFLIFGSALGAVRHGGFIPWDDDIDIGMLRDSFEVFRQKGHQFFPDYIDIQYGVSDRGADLLMRIRDKRTTGIISGERHLSGNKGAFIEIYVYDNVYDGWRGKYQIMTSRILCSIMCTNRKGMIGKTQKAIRIFAGLPLLWILYEKNCIRANRKKTNCVNLISLPKYAKQSRFKIQTELVAKTAYIPFEYTTARVPIGNTVYLTQLYKAFMELPPVEKRGVYHELIVFYDPNKPYTEYEGSSTVEQYFSGNTNLDLLRKE